MRSGGYGWVVKLILYRYWTVSTSVNGCFIDSAVGGKVYRAAELMA